jgi:Tyrosyl-tRNA synthetase
MAESSPPTEKLTNLTLSEDTKSKNSPPKKTDSKQGKNAPPKQQREWTQEMEADLQRILTVGEECISPEELKKLILAKGRGSDHPVGFNLYDGFEPSGRMHIAQGVFKAMNVNKCTLEGTNSKFTFWVADWFALMNDKMGGDLEKIKTVGKYLIEVWKAAGMNLENVVFKWASEEITNNADVYWPTMLDVARRFNVTRIKKCCQIMGRLEGNLTSAQVLYPLMQCTDVFFLKADICQLGVDQRKVNMLAREYCDAAKIKNKPIILSHHMLYGLKAGQEKMSKSDPDSAVFMEDTAEDVERKVMAAYCPNQEVEESSEEAKGSGDAGKESMHLTKDTLKNPCLDYIQNIILCPPGSTFTVQGKTYDTFEPIRADFLDGKITEEELKKGLIQELNNLLQPVREHFTHDENAKHLLEQVRQFKKEGNGKVDEKKIRRLNLVAMGKIQSNCHAVFAPLPTANPSLQDVLGTLTKIRSNNNNNGGISTVLFLPDWTARVCNRCDADVKVIDAFYTIFLAALQALDADTMKNVVVMKQSEAILQDPSNYWISVINIGRYFSLDDVMGSNVQDSDGVGIVIGRLMKIADIMGLEPGSIAMDSSEDESIERALIERYYEEKLQSMTKPMFFSTKTTSLALQMIDSEAHKTENYEYFVLDDPKVHGKSKMKKAFCEPGNIEFCPPIVLANAFGPADIEIKRSVENGGDVVYQNKQDMESDFKSGSLHPGDLKATASTIMVGVLDKISSIIKKDKGLTIASKSLKAFEKKMSKKKK